MTVKRRCDPTIQWFGSMDQYYNYGSTIGHHRKPAGNCLQHHFQSLFLCHGAVSSIVYKRTWVGQSKIENWLWQIIELLLIVSFLLVWIFYYEVAVVNLLMLAKGESMNYVSRRGGRGSQPNTYAKYYISLCSKLAYGGGVKNWLT